VPGNTDNVHESDDDDAGLDEDELEIVKDAGIIATSSKTRKRRSSRHQAKHVVFVENEEEGMRRKFDWPARITSCAAARQYATNQNTHAVSLCHSESNGTTNAGDLGWQKPERKRKEKKDTSAKAVIDNGDASARSEAVKVSTPPVSICQAYIYQRSQTHRTRLLKELSARLHRDRMLRYTERELEMQRLLMGKGGSKKLKGVERVDGTERESEDEDAEDAGRGRRSRTSKGVEDKAYKPRVYKWRAERKR
jgi:U3 small nucleolar RNA-associated protein 11